MGKNKYNVIEKSIQFPSSWADVESGLAKLCLGVRQGNEQAKAVAIELLATSSNYWVVGVIARFLAKEGLAECADLVGALERVTFALDNLQADVPMRLVFGHLEAISRVAGGICLVGLPEDLRERVGTIHNLVDEMLDPDDMAEWRYVIHRRLELAIEGKEFAYLPFYRRKKKD